MPWARLQASSANQYSTFQVNFFPNSDNKLYCGANDYIVVINMTTGSVETKFRCLDLKFEITCLCLSPDSKSLAVGFKNGALVIVNLETSSSEKKFFLHKSEITTIKFFKEVMML